MTIAFCTSFRSKALAKGTWPYHVWLLECAVRSMLGQLRGEVRVVVGCHEVPETPFARDPRVTFVPVTIDRPERTNEAMIVDKVMKLSMAVEHAVRAGADYVALNDADDLVSNAIGGHVMDRVGHAGWYSAEQRHYTYGGRLMRLERIPSPRSGPFVAVRSDLLAFARPPFSGNWFQLIAGGGEHEYLELLARHQQPVNTLAAVGLAYFQDLMRLERATIDPLPFAANVVINHADSMSTEGGTYGYQPIAPLAFVRRTISWAPTFRLMTPAIRREFHVPHDRDIPRAYRSGSVFWR